LIGKASNHPQPALRSLLTRHSDRPVMRWSRRRTAARANGAHRSRLLTFTTLMLESAAPGVSVS
jgi:hypothetical protein